MSILPSDGDLYYDVRGTGPDVLLLHGWFGSGRMWLPLMEALQGEVRLWAVDLAGFGASRPARRDGLNLEQHAALLLDFCRRHDLRPHAVIGHSMGGLLAFKMALARPQFTGRLVVLAPLVRGRFGVPFDLSWLFRRAALRPVFLRSRVFWSAIRSGRRITQIPYLNEADNARIYNDFRRANWQAAARAAVSMAQENLERDLSQIRQPTLVIVGTRDNVVPCDEGRLAARLIPTAQLVEWPDVHHYPMDERPADVIDLVRAFLAASATRGVVAGVDYAKMTGTQAAVHPNRQAGGDLWNP